MYHGSKEHGRLPLVLKVLLGADCRATGEWERERKSSEGGNGFIFIGSVSCLLILSIHSGTGGLYTIQKGSPHFLARRNPFRDVHTTRCSGPLHAQYSILIHPLLYSPRISDPVCESSYIVYNPGIPVPSL